MKKFLSFFVLITLLSVTSLCAQSTGKPVLHILFNGSSEDETYFPNHSREHDIVYVQDRFGNDCGAAQFNGTTSYIAIPGYTPLNQTNKAITIAAWVKVDAGTDNLKWITLVCKGTSPTEDSLMPQFRFQATTITYSLNYGFSESMRVPFSFNTWYHYVQTYDGSQVKLYQNGKLAAQFPFAGKLGRNRDALEIGRDMPGEIEYFQGSIDDLRIYDYALNSAQVNSLYADDSERTSAKPCAQQPNSGFAKSPPTASSITKQPNTIGALSKQNIQQPVVAPNNPAPQSLNPASPQAMSRVSTGNPPFIKFQAPYLSGKVNDAPIDISGESNTDIRLKVQNVDDASQIQCSLDGESMPFHFDAKAKLLTATISGVNGLSTFEVVAENQFGNATDFLNLKSVILPKPAPIKIHQPKPKRELDDFVDNSRIPLIAGDSIDIVRTIDIPIETFQIACYDHRKVDNDTVTILLNNTALFENLALKAKSNQSAVRAVNLKAGGEYLLLAKSINEGHLPTNTLKVELRNDAFGFLQEIDLTSKKGMTQGVRIRCVNRS